VTPALRLDAVSASPPWGGAVDGLSLEVSPGEIVRVEATRAAAQTLLRLLSGRLTPTRGRIELLGRDTFGRAPSALVGACVVEGSAESWRVRRIFRDLYPSWDDALYSALHEEVKERTQGKSSWARARAAYAVPAFASGAPVVVLPVPSKPFGRGPDEEARDWVIATARRLRRTLVLVGDAGGDVDRMVALESPIRAVALESPIRAPRASASAPPNTRHGQAKPVLRPMDRRRVAILLKHAMVPGVQGAVELLGMLAMVAIVQGSDFEDVGIFVPGIALASFLPVASVGWIAPASPIGVSLSPAWPLPGWCLPTPAAELRAASCLAALLRLPLFASFLVALCWGIDVPAAIEWHLRLQPSWAPLVALTFVAPPLLAAQSLVVGTWRRAALGGATVGAAALAVWSASQTAATARMWAVAATSGLVLLGAAIIWISAVALVWRGLLRTAAGTGRPGPPSASAAALIALAAGWLALLPGALPEPDWRDVRDPRFGAVADDAFLIRGTVDEDTPQVPGLPLSWLVPFATFDGLPLPEGTQVLVTGGESWARLRQEGATAWIEVADTMDGPATARSDSWTMPSSGRFAGPNMSWWPELQAFVAYGRVDGEVALFWIAPDGDKGGVRAPDGTFQGWTSSRDDDGAWVLTPKPRFPRECPGEGDSIGRGPVRVCETPEGARERTLLSFRDGAYDETPLPDLPAHYPVGSPEVWRRTGGEPPRFLFAGRGFTDPEGKVLQLEDGMWTELSTLELRGRHPTWLSRDSLLLLDIGATATTPDSALCRAPTGHCERIPHNQ